MQQRQCPGCLLEAICTKTGYDSDVNTCMTGPLASLLMYLGCNVLTQEALDVSQGSETGQPIIRQANITWINGIIPQFLPKPQADKEVYAYFVMGRDGTILEQMGLQPSSSNNSVVSIKGQQHEFERGDYTIGGVPPTGFGKK